MALPDLHHLQGIPTDADGPVFNAPWQAQAFALVVRLQEQGVFTWQEWAETLGESIDAARAHGDPDLGNTYYEHWLAALEKITLSKGLATDEILSEQKQAAHEEHQRLHSDHNHSHDQ
ncbi:MAG TPA: nitrile hydratase accessory protein [Gammaproteobacteria bacterium]|nr:nitrile hydratase accessory protein [Gammaproteobacteria bacterium]